MLRHSSELTNTAYNIALIESIYPPEADQPVADKTIDNLVFKANYFILRVANFMKTISKITFFVLIIFGIAFSQSASAQEKIDNYEVDIKVSSDSSIQVTEKIFYDFDSLEKHGIFRTIPFKYKARGGNFTLRLSDFSVTDENGNSYNFTKSKEGNYWNIKIGDADKLISGQHWYFISYKVQRAINYFPDHDELYWNAIGSEWPVTINKALVSVQLPQILNDDQVQIQCFKGLYGSTASCADFSYENSSGIARFGDSDIYTGQNLTIVVGWPKGITQKPSLWQNFLYVITDNWILFTPIFAFLIMFNLWMKKGRDPKVKIPIVAQYEAPDGLTPSEMAFIRNEKTKNEDISAEIIYLATLGFLKIKKIEKGKILKSTDYELELLKNKGEAVNEFDKKLLDSLFSGDKKKVELSDLKDKFYKDLSEIEGKIQYLVIQKGYFPTAPWKTKALYISIGLAAVCAAFIAAGFFSSGLAVLASVINAIIIIALGVAMPKRTAKGAETRNLIDGLKEYLTVAEKDRIKFHNAPEKISSSAIRRGGRNPELFEKLLPYAMVLGVENQWAKQFEEIYKTPPSWYEDSSGRPFSAYVFASYLGDFSSASAATLSSSPSSSSSGGSGFSGGGSGGGGGGGGGGSW